MQSYRPMMMGKRKDQSGYDQGGLVYSWVNLNRCGSFIGNRHRETLAAGQLLELTSCHALYLILKCRLRSHLRRIRSGNTFTRHLGLTRHDHIWCDLIPASDRMAYEGRWLSDAKKQEFQVRDMNSLNKASQE